MKVIFQNLGDDFLIQVYFTKLYTLQTEKLGKLQVVTSKVKKPQRTKTLHFVMLAQWLKHSFTTWLDDFSLLDSGLENLCCSAES